MVFMSSIRSLTRFSKRQNGDDENESDDDDNQGPGPSSSDSPTPQGGFEITAPGGDVVGVAPYAPGARGGYLTAIDDGPWAGRGEGGGARADIFGTRVYGSGYPGEGNRNSTSGRFFPYYFWPLSWSGLGVGSTVASLAPPEYGNASNMSRPGGRMSFFAVHSSLNSSSEGGAVNSTTLKVVADYSSADTLISALDSNCSSVIQSLAGSSPLAIDLNDTSDPDLPPPEEVVQYYRASTAALALAGYNDTEALVQNAPEGAPLPDWIDPWFLGCVNETVGRAIPLVDLNFISGGYNGVALSASAPEMLHTIMLGVALWSMLA